MNMFKFIVFLIFLAFLAGCDHKINVFPATHAKNPPCQGPNRPSGPGCYYAMEIKEIKGDHALGIIPRALYVEDGKQKGKMDPEEYASKFKTEQNLYRIGVAGKGADSLEKGKIYWFRSRYNSTFDRPLERDTDDNGNILQGMTEPQFKEELAKRQRQGHKKH